MHPGKQGLQVVQTTIGTGIVHYPYLGIQTLNSFVNTVQTLFQKEPDIVIDYDNG